MSAHVIAVPEVLDEECLEGLSASLSRAASDAEARVFVLRSERGAGGAFSRGMDLASIVASDRDATQGLGVSAYVAVLHLLRRAPRPTIAVIEAEALGGGLGIAAACDHVIATPAARFGLPEGLFGIIPAMVAPVLRERLSTQQIRLLAFECSARDAAWAHSHGLADELVAADEIDARLRARVRALSRVASSSVRAMRRWMDESSALPRHDAIARGAEVLGELLREPATLGALRAFIEEGAVPWST